MDDDHVFIEMRGEDEPRGRESKTRVPPSRLAAVSAGIVAILLTVVVANLVGDDGGRGVRPAEQPDKTVPDAATPSRIPAARQAADCYEVTPSAANLRAVFESIGGFEGLLVGVAIGAFDVVTFDPFDNNRLLAANRAGYGAAENQDVNQQWILGDGDLVQSVWDPATPHDFVHYNVDGTITMWVNGADDVGYAPRNAVVIDRDGNVVTTSSSPIYADRSAVDSGTIFALIGDPREYAPRDIGYVSLLADDGEQQTRLGRGDDFAWIDVPTPGLLVAYPGDPTGVTRVWDTQTLEELDEHPLAGRPYQRVAVASDATIALGVTHDGELEPLDLVTGRVGDRFGHVDVTEVDRPVTLNGNGTVAFTVERSGVVSIWAVGEETPIATYHASTGLPRWLPTSRSAARLTSSLAADATRMALRIDARPQVSVSWQLIDTDIESWLARARQMADSGLSPLEPRRQC